MNEVERILHQYDRVMGGDAWHGDALWPILEGVSAECAAHRGFPEAHTIWELVLHMIFWEGVASVRLAGQRAGLDEALNFPPTPEPTENNWQKTREHFRVSNQKFREALARLDPAKVDELSAAGKRTYYDEAHGAIQHHIYHAGQIAVLKKNFQQSMRAGRL